MVAGREAEEMLFCENLFTGTRAVLVGSVWHGSQLALCGHSIDGEQAHVLACLRFAVKDTAPDCLPPGTVSSE